MDKKSFVTLGRLSEFGLWRKLADRRAPLDFYLEITARCNNNCRHCYINLSAGNAGAQQKELSLAEIGELADQAAALGVMSCLINGGEPLLRPDFSEIYLSLRKRGLLVSVFTNACLVTQEHVDLFKKYPPRDAIEVTVYGVTEETYERVTRQSGSYAAFRRGLDLLLNSGIRVRMKAMAIRSNVHELQSIASFCRQYTTDYFRFDPFLHLRHDFDPRRNAEIRAERLTPAEVVAVEQADEERARTLKKGCDKLIVPEFANNQSDRMFPCGAGNQSFVVSYDGIFRLCADLWHPDCVYDLRQGSLAQAWEEFVPQVRDLDSTNPEVLEGCRRCPIVNLCLWCPAHAHLETGNLDGFSKYFCEVAHARAAALAYEPGDIVSA